MCDSEFINEYGDLEIADCTEDFLDKEFWTQMREEQFWFESVNEVHFDLYMYFDYYHSEEHHDDYDHDDECWWRQYEGDCQAFEFSAEDTCTWYISWSPCVEETFICESNTMNEYGDFEMRDCSGDSLTLTSGL